MFWNTHAQAPIEVLSMKMKFRENWENLELRWSFCQHHQNSRCQEIKERKPIFSTNGHMDWDQRWNKRKKCGIGKSRSYVVWMIFKLRVCVFESERVCLCVCWIIETWSISVCCCCLTTYLPVICSSFLKKFFFLEKM